MDVWGRSYFEGQRLYFRDSAPWERADLVIDNTDPRKPRTIPAATCTARAAV